MNSKIEDSGLFSGNVGDGERCCFELGISLATVFHQFVGTPVGLDSVSEVEKAIETSVCEQPFVIDVKIEISRDEWDGYSSLKPEEINAWVTVSYNDVTVYGRLSFVEELDYPLMWIEEKEVK
ncbi:dihydroneopterin aldolase family protein [Methanonatronarchaeum sp. AMET6-2]|uniref:dihydroneopterin aldolase family protein n=1 Tax=Methanonatronarchaeum sp. AMET6-2 TaxID=2933293 RepID=UPI001214A936|nr:dihydroneopterin aldolase family protein [Methanonatronarchaeum sp. AMET6-2]RZN60311.1 MAG: dihydroneopterin aldolase [Methanonatronarchaeia archaeon]UOY10558.1 dihydroneopterin aldolase family protein [Methanonatronarchaeum sp. AMET6-2]